MYELIVPLSALSDDRLNPADFRVLCALMHHARTSDEKLNIKTIMRKSGVLSRTTVHRAIKRLCGSGYLSNSEPSALHIEFEQHDLATHSELVLFLHNVG